MPLKHPLVGETWRNRKTGRTVEVTMLEGWQRIHFRYASGEKRQLLLTRFELWYERA